VIKSCPGEITAPGTYNVNANLVDSGSSCIWIAGDGITVNLNGHTITGTGSDYCLYVEDASYARTVRNDRINGGKGNLTGCGYGLYLDYASGTTVRHVTITRPVDDGVYEGYSIDGSYTGLHVVDQSGSADGFYMYGGTGDHVLDSTVTSSGHPDSFYAYYEADDTFSGDTVRYPNGPGGTGDGFTDYYGNGDSWVGDRAYGQEYGFILETDSYGTITAENDLASNPGETSYGFYDYGNYDDLNYGPNNHSVFSHNTSIGYYHGFYEYYNIYATSSYNSALGASGYGFYIDYPTGERFSHDLSDGTYKGTAYGSSAYGFYFEYNYGYYRGGPFFENTSENNYYGFYNYETEDDYPAVRGYGNKAIHDTYDSLGVQTS
jgi:hypothetical protein